MENNKLTYKQLYLQHDGRICHKWSSYLDVYERTFATYRDRPLKLLEVGVYHGGSLQLWKKYFQSNSQFIGVDLDPRCLEYTEEHITIETGDQSNPDFWVNFFQRHGKFDIIIDDGSHDNRHQTLTFMMAWPNLRDGGVYLVEDLHCAYWAEYGGGYKNKMSFIEFSKDRIDDINAFHSRDANSFKKNQFTHEIESISYYDSIAVFTKREQITAPFPVARGSWSRTPSEAEATGFQDAFMNAKKLANEV